MRSFEGRGIGEVRSSLRAGNSCGGLSQAAARAADGASASMYVFLADARPDASILGGRRKLEVKPWATVREVKAGIARLLRIPATSQRLRVPPAFSGNVLL